MKKTNDALEIDQGDRDAVPSDSEQQNDLSLVLEIVDLKNQTLRTVTLKDLNLPMRRQQQPSSSSSRVVSIVEREDGDIVLLESDGTVRVIEIHQERLQESLRVWKNLIGSNNDEGANGRDPASISLEYDEEDAGAGEGEGEGSGSGSGGGSGAGRGGGGGEGEGEGREFISTKTNE